MTIDTTMKPKKGVRFVASQSVSETARRTLGLERAKPRKRGPNEAKPIAIHNGTMPSDQPYRTGDGDVKPVYRPGSELAMDVRSFGFPT